MPPTPFSHTILLSYPRSGNHLFRRLIEEITQQNTHSIYPEDPFPMAGARAAADKGPRIYKAHRIRHISQAGLQVDPKEAKLILLLRDPYECVASDMKHHPKAFRVVITYIQLMKYLENMAYFSAFPGEKLLVRYESFYSEPTDLICSLSEFLGMGSPNSTIDLHQVAASALAALHRKADSHHALTYYRDRRFLGWNRLLIPQKFRDYVKPYASVRHLL